MDYPKVYVLVRGRNAHPYVERCLRSILFQTYSNVLVLFVDDASEYSREVKKRINKLLKGQVVVWRKERYYSVRNAYEMIHRYCDDPEGIVLNVDADDWLAAPSSITKLVQLYRKASCLFSYGDCYLWSGEDSQRIDWQSEERKNLRHSLLPVASKAMEASNVAYSKRIERSKTFRSEAFQVLHPRSWKVKAFKAIPKEAFLREDGSWLQFCEDQAIFFPLFELFPNQYAVSSLPLAVYNQANVAADIKLYRLETLRDEIEIRRKPSYEPVTL